MIATLEGRIQHIGADHLIVALGGVGLRVLVPRSVLENAGGTGRPVHLHTHLLVRETELTLFGFPTAEELTLFEMLLGVSGVGPKVALAILSTLSPELLKRAILHEETAVLQRVPGIGKKTAERLIMEMRDKVGEVGAPSLPGQKIDVGSSARAEAFDALVALGYKANEVNRLFGKLDIDGLSAEDIIRQALKQAAA